MDNLDIPVPDAMSNKSKAKSVKVKRIENNLEREEDKDILLNRQKTHNNRLEVTSAVLEHFEVEQSNSSQNKCK